MGNPTKHISKRMGSLSKTLQDQSGTKRSEYHGKLRERGERRQRKKTHIPSQPKGESDQKHFRMN